MHVTNSIPTALISHLLDHSLAAPPPATLPAASHCRHPAARLNKECTFALLPRLDPSDSANSQQLLPRTRLPPSGYAHRIVRPSGRVQRPPPHLEPSTAVDPGSYCLPTAAGCRRPATRPNGGLRPHRCAAPLARLDPGNAAGSQQHFTCCRRLAVRPCPTLAPAHRAGRACPAGCLAVPACRGSSERPALSPA